MVDLDKAVLHHTIAIFLPFARPQNQPRRNRLQLLFFLTGALVRRARHYKRPEDIESCTTYLQYLRHEPLEAYGVPRNQVLSFLIEALTLDIELESDAVTVMRYFEEMADLCHDLIIHMGNGSPYDSVTAMAVPVNAQFTGMGGPQTPLNRVIESLREANRRLPNFHDVSIVLAWSLLIQDNCLTNDYEEAIAILSKIIAYHVPTDNPTAYQPRASSLLALFGLSWLSSYGNPEVLQDAIHRLRTLLSAVSPDHPHTSIITATLAHLQARRFSDFGFTEGHEEVGSSNPQVSGSSTFRNQRASLGKPDAVKSLVMTAGEDQHTLLTIGRSTDVADIEEAIKYYRVLLASSHPSGLFGLFPSVGLASFLLHAFGQTNKIKYLNEAIPVLRNVLKNPHGGDVHLVATRQLISSLSTRLQLLHQREDFDELMQLFPSAVNVRRARIPEQFQFACNWVSLAQNSNHSTTQIAYENALSLMRDSLTFAPTLEVQHFRLIAMRECYEKLPLNYASFQISIGQLEQAIETLEQGRALLWSEMRGLRTSVEHLRAADSHLAEQFAAVNRDLETVTMSVMPSGSEEIDDEVDGRGRADPFSRLVVQQRQFLEKRERLISQIQALPGFEDFLKSPQFDTLRSAASHGPVIIINHCEWRSDILILLHDSPPSLITMTDNFYHDAIKLKDRLVLTRKNHRLESKQYQGALRSVLKSLYELVGRPVIQELQKLNIPEQSRIWWCPTSALCSLPLHAMGPILPHGRVKRYFSDLYISSYTPTLSTLIESRKRSGPVFEKPSILLVAQPDEALLHIFEEVWVIQCLDTEVTTLLSKRATPSNVVDGLRSHRFSHFACHGILQPGKPFDASFKLYGGERLTLLNIVRSHFPSADFAFLSACHTAEITDESIADEALHLTAAMQYCGFRSVVGTMWALADTDGRDMAGDFYKTMYSDEEALAGVPYYARSARALRDAVQNLRRRKVTLERWVNFVHFGA